MACTSSVFSLLWLKPCILHELRRDLELTAILVSSGCYNKVPQSGWLINSRNVFLIVQEVASLKSGYQPGWVLVRTLFWLVDCQFLTRSSHGWEQTQEGKSLMTHKNTNCACVGSTLINSSDPDYCSKAPPPNITILGR